MNKIHVATISFFSLTLSLSAATVRAEWANGGISGARVVEVTTQQDGHFYVLFDRDICDGGGVVNRIGSVNKDLSPNGVAWTKEGATMILRVALAAKLSGNTVKVYADNSGSRWGCRMGALKIE